MGPSSIELSESLLRKIAGWEAVNRAKALVAEGRVGEAEWSPPNLRGVVRAGSATYKCGLTIYNVVHVENLCHCRDSREWGTICAHSVAVGMHLLAPPKPPPESPQDQGAGGGGEESAMETITRQEDKCLTRAASPEEGEPLELHVILPPNFETALGRGRAMLVLEGEAQGCRKPLTAFPLDQPFILADNDAALLDEIERLAGGQTPAMLTLSAREFASLLPLLADHPRLTLGKSGAFTVASEPWRLRVRVGLEDSGEITLRPSRGDLPTPLPSADRLWGILGDRIQPLDVPAVCAGGTEVRLSREKVPEFLLRDWPRLCATCEVEADFTEEDFALEPMAPVFHLGLKGGLAMLDAKLSVRYGKQSFRLGRSEEAPVWQPDPDNPTRYLTRNPVREKEALERLLSAGFIGPDKEGVFKLRGEERVLPFFARVYPRIEKEWEVDLDPRLQHSTETKLERIEPRFQVRPSGEQWFDLQVDFSSSGGQTFSPAEIARLLQTGQSHQRLRNGRVAVFDTGAVEELQQVLLDCDPQQHEQGYRLEKSQAGFLEGTLLELGFESVGGSRDWLQSASGRSGDVSLKPPATGDLEKVLRGYQTEGVAWLWFLRQNGFSGILADEMGLGKTLQTLALLRVVGEVARAEGSAPRPSLIVCPTSLVQNWQREIERFVPELKALVLHGPNRHARFGEIAEHDLAITSYALVRRDLEAYRGIEFDTVVLDEAQHIKNRQTQNARAVKAIRSARRLVLTGTPMENSVQDLWSIFDFLMPGYLGSANDFRERYELPIVRDRDRRAQARLSRRLRPFVLRRLKRDVASELPEKIEQVAWCDLTGAQAAVYREILEAGRREVHGAVEAQGFQKSRMVILQALLRLRQTCCDLRLLQMDGIDPGEASGKLELFSELLEETIDGGHRVLVFSQFVSMLSLLRERLEAEDLGYCYLDGSTKNRQQEVDRFQREEHIPVFLISLKAGGTGLNLTGADTVVHFDPWWNPAIEDQATDRAHRIGQSRVVTSYKLIARNTVEEKILNLQNRKRELIRGMLGGEEAFAESLTWEEIQGLFE